jgi:hypothetical protein
MDIIFAGLILAVIDSVAKVALVALSKKQNPKKSKRR